MIEVDFGDGFDWGKPEASGENGGNCFAVTRHGQRPAAVNNGQLGIGDTKVGGDIVIWAAPADFVSLVNHAKHGR